MRKRFYHTPSTIPERVRPEVVKGWNAMWNRLRRWERRDRELEFKVGTLLKIDGLEFRLKAKQWHLEIHLVSDYLEKHVKKIDGSCAFGSEKPYTYLDDLQDAIDELVVLEVLQT